MCSERLHALSAALTVSWHMLGSAIMSVLRELRVRVRERAHVFGGMVMLRFAATLNNCAIVRLLRVAIVVGSIVEFGGMTSMSLARTQSRCLNLQ